MAEQEGCQQCLWLVGEDHEITEVGAMNIFILMKNASGTGTELVTPPLDSGCILPGVTRRSILEMAREWGEFEVSERKITMGEVGLSYYKDHVQQCPFPSLLTSFLFNCVSKKI